ncbi:hypothetical protein NQ315_004890 [Exocentrus adspersus]|uniref:S1 motif domain-containing protein n=1 Tax=Exocentrus adspersus TaxID=1586481 RepID=A0AAV8W3Y7_9CUCU|nr:hypothetical protein NQ315_004890 [Exocentrus adspersus]
MPSTFVEEDFPRGGRKVISSQKRSNPENNLFTTDNNKKSKKSKKVKKTQKEAVTEDVFYDSLNVLGTLSYSKIQEGMIILGCVRHVTNFSLEVELPGLTFGSVHVTNVSDAFTTYLSSTLEKAEEDSENLLKQMFQIGQFVIVKVLNIENEERGTKLKCSLKPSDINYEKSHNSFVKGMLVWGCVRSVLEHGYEISLGVKNCRVFLPLKNVETPLLIGQPMWCVVHKSEITNSVATLRVSSKTQHIKDSQVDKINSLHDVIPGMKIEIVTDKVTSNGIQGKFLNDYFAYVDHTQLRSPLDELDVYSEGNLLKAVVLYIEPSTKITHFTLRDVDPVPAPQHKVGDVLSAKVISKAPNGIYLRLLPSKEKCFVTNRRLIQALSKKSDSDLPEAITAKFPIGSKLTCRILDYNHISRMYVCAVDQALVNEKLFSNKDVTIGQLLNLTVDIVKAEGIVVTSGHIRGFVPNLHVSNAEFSENLKKKFKPGDKVNGRVLHVQDDNIIFTLKSGLVQSEKCLTSLEEAKRGSQYPGVVVKTKPAGAMVVFYNNIVGWLSKRRLDVANSDAEVNPTEYFYRGQVINPWVLGVKGDKVALTLKAPHSLKKQINMKVGQRVKGFVSKIYKDRVAVKSVRGLMLGIVPVHHLSSLPLCAAVLKEKALAAKAGTLGRKYKIRKFEDLKPGNVLRCSYISTSELGIYVLPLISDFASSVLIKNADIVDDGQPTPKFAKDQSIIAKILRINYDTKDLDLTIKQNKVFDNNVETVVTYFNQYLSEIQYLRDFGYNHGWDICQYRPGERIMCKVKVLDKGGCLVTLPNNVTGLVARHLCPDNLQQGQLIEGVFLCQDFKENYAEVCLRHDISQKINPIQDGVISITSLASSMTEKILVKNDFILGVLKQNGGRKQLVYIPSHLTVNDRIGCHSFYKKQKFKTCICGKVNSYLVGISKTLFLTLDKQVSLIQRRLLTNIQNLDTNQSCITQTDTNESEEALSANGSSQNEVSSEEEEETVRDTVLESTDSVNEEKSEDESFENDSNSSGVCGTKRKRHEIGHGKNIKFGDETIKKFANSDSITGPLPVLPGVSTFFNPGTNDDNVASSDEEEEQREVTKKKVKLTPKERAKLAREEEERLSKIEKELADSTTEPKSVEQFERLLVANPNSSEYWSRYISFHAAATDLDKARSVAKRALETIDMTFIDDKFNIWITMLNMENMFGTKDSFENTFNEAIKYNDPLKIYLQAITLLSNSEKYSEMEEKIKKVRSKYKHEPTMWLEVAKIYYLINKFKEARNIKEAALKSIQDRKTQLNIIIRFAIMEFKYGEEQQGAAIFETVLSADPKKVTVWITYVDQLVKKNRIEQARKVLERSVCQQLPLKSMKTLFLKFKMFEEQHGTPDSIEAVKQKAAEFVSKAVKK